MEEILLKFIHEYGDDEEKYITTAYICFPSQRVGCGIIKNVTLIG